MPIAMYLYAQKYRARVYLRHFLRRYRVAFVLTSLLWALLIFGAIELVP